MKTNVPTRKFLKASIFIAGVFCNQITLCAQICSDNLNTVYGLSTTGQISPINVNTAVNGGPVAASGTATTSANGMGYSNLNGKFYFFLISGTGAAPSPQFQSYDPGTATFTTLAAAPATLLNNQKIRTGCVNNAGTYYYTINPKNNGTTTPSLYCYNIALNSWTTITTSFLNPAAVSQNTNFNSLNSGDMTFDGSGNLWILLSSTSNYSLYKIAAPVPTTVTASVTVQQIVPVTPVPVAGFAITGVAFNSAGTLFLSTGAGDNKLYKMTTPSSGLLFIGTMPTDDVAGDLTTCSAPLWVLPTAAFISFNAELQQGDTRLSWTAAEDESITGYNIEYSGDGVHWSVIGVTGRKYAAGYTTSSYNYIHHLTLSGGFYRIVQISAGGKETISVNKWVTGNSKPWIAIGPNPVKEILYLFNLPGNNNKYRAQVFDLSGKTVYTAIIKDNQPSLNISGLMRGSYTLRLSDRDNQTICAQQFIKW